MYAFPRDTGRHIHIILSENNHLRHDFGAAAVSTSDNRICYLRLQTFGEKSLLASHPMEGWSYDGYLPYNNTNILGNGFLEVCVRGLTPPSTSARLLF